MPYKKKNITVIAQAWNACTRNTRGENYEIIVEIMNYC